MSSSYKETRILSGSGISVIDFDDVFTSEFDGLKEAAASVNRNKNKDLMFVRFDLVHEGPNANGDYFFREELENAWDTLINKPLNWEHGEPNIGVITDAVLRKPDEASSDQRWYIECAAVVWKRRYPMFAEIIKRDALIGRVATSMECYFPDYVYILGNEDNIVLREEASFLENYVGSVYEGSPVYRGLLGILFGGVGVVANPADKHALFKSVARKTTDEDKEDNVMTDKDVEMTDVQKEENVNQEVSEAREESGAVECKKCNDNNEKCDCENEQAEKDANESVIEEEVKAEDVDTEEGIEKEKAESLANMKAEYEKVMKLYESLMEEFDAIKAEYEAYKEQAEAYKQQVEYEKAEARKNLLARNRYDELIKAGLMFSEETSAKIMKKIREQTDEEFTEFKELLIEARSASAKEAKVSEDNEAKASSKDHIPIEAVTFESAEAKKTVDPYVDLVASFLVK